MDNGVLYPANGLVIAAGRGAVLVDPGWEPAQTEAILAWTREALPPGAVKAVITHSHADRSAGIAVLRQAKVPVVGLRLTRERLEQERKPAPGAVDGLEATPWKDPLGFELLYPGPGHAPDNLVVWVPKARVLFGGCFLKAVTAKDLGNVADASIQEWPRSIAKVRAAYPEIAVQVPGHGAARGDALAHTAALLAQPQKPAAATAGRR